MCGIFGIVNKKVKKFDYPTFCTLGIANDSRGGDSCGVFIDGEVEYGVFTKKLFQDYFPESEFLKKRRKEEIKVAFGHCRKASVGAIDAEHAQPVVLRDKSGRTRFVMVHNGTIYNYEELAKKYIPEIDIKGMTDSQVMARIFYYKGYDCLSEYYGGSVFVIADYRQPEEPAVYLFKGRSNRTKAGQESDERPLYISYGKNELVYSSIDTYLRALRPGRNVWTIEPNALIQYIGEDEEDPESKVYLKIVKKYPRDKVYQTREEKSYGSYGGYYGGYYGEYGYWGGEDDYYPVGGIGRRGGGFGYSTGLFPEQAKKSSSQKTGGTTQTSKIPATKSNFISADTKTNTYRLGDKLLHGKYKFSKYGRILEEKDSDRKDFGEYEVWFWKGYALRARKYFKFLTYLETQAKKNKVNFDTMFMNLVAYFGLNRLYVKNNVMVEATGVSSYRVFSGNASFLGEGYVYRFDTGEYKNVKVFQDYGLPFEALDSKKDDGIILSKIQNTCKSLMK